MGLQPTALEFGKHCPAMVFGGLVVRRILKYFRKDQNIRVSR